MFKPFLLFTEIYVGTFMSARLISHLQSEVNILWELVLILESLCSFWEFGLGYFPIGFLIMMIPWQHVTRPNKGRFVPILKRIYHGLSKGLCLGLQIMNHNLFLFFEFLVLQKPEFF